MKTPDEIFFIDPALIGSFHQGARGSLFSYELEHMLPFSIKRFFFVHTPIETVSRGSHGHKECWQALVAISGAFIVTEVNSAERSWTLDKPSQVLCIPPRNIISYSNIEPQGILGVFCSHSYDSGDYIYPS